MRDHLEMGGAAKAGKQDTTFLLTEVVDSTRLWEVDDEDMAAATARLDVAVAEVVAHHAGSKVKPRGEGDAYFLTFGSPTDAAGAAAELIRRLVDEPLLSIRAAIHVGPAELRDGDWYGTTVNRCARLRAVARARQVLVSADAAAALPEAEVRSLGRHRLKDLDEPTEVFQLASPGLDIEFPPLPTLVQHSGLALPLNSFVGRDALVDEVVALLADRRSVTLVGPPGVGKRRLALEARRVAFDRGLGSDHRITCAYAPTAIDAESAVVPVGPLLRHDATRLLLDRLDADPVGDLDGLVDRCEGLPLALELAAKRASSLSLSRLVDRIDHEPWTALGGNRSADPPHHRSLREAIDHCSATIPPEALGALRSATPPPWASGWFPEGRTLRLLEPIVRP